MPSAFEITYLIEPTNDQVIVGKRLVHIRHQKFEIILPAHEVEDLYKELGKKLKHIHEGVRIKEVQCKSKK